MRSNPRVNLESISHFVVYKTRKIFVFLQLEDPPNPNLLEAFVQIRDDATCNATYSGAVTDGMICTGPHSGYSGPYYVSIL